MWSMSRIAAPTVRGNDVSGRDPKQCLSEEVRPPATHAENRLVGRTSQIRQCAWCLMVMDGTGTYSIQPGRKVRTATHGICPSCKEAMRAEIDAQPNLVAA